MSARDDLWKAVAVGNLPETVRLVAALDDSERRAAAKELRGELKRLRAAYRYGFLDRTVINALLLAGAGTIGGPAAAATWLCRSDLRPWWPGDATGRLCEALCDVTSFRPAEWRAEVAHRVAARLRTTDDDLVRWHIAAALARSAGGAPPVSDGFVVGWATDGVSPGELADDPFLETLVPKLFEVDGVGAVLSRPSFRNGWDTAGGQSWATALTGLARAGRLDRAALLDGCVSRFLRGGTPHDLRWFVQLHEALEPTDDEATARVRDYVRLLPAAPPTVADLALGQVRRVDDLEHLDTALFDEAAGAVLFRTEKKLVRATLTWLDRTARKRDRVDATLRAVLVVLGSDDLDLRERAVKILVRHAAKAGDTAREEVREAAVGLPTDLRATVAAAFGEVEAAAGPAPLAAPPPFTPREWPTPIGSLTELADEFADLVHAEEQWVRAERFLGALVEFAHRDLDATRAALRKATPWLIDHDGASSWHGTNWGVSGITLRGLTHPRSRHELINRVTGFVREQTTRISQWAEPPMSRLLGWRARELASAVGRTPFLLATPTRGSGHIDPDVLVGRLERLEAAGLEPGAADVLLAKLRVPREIDPATVARARTLTSPVGREMASWLAGGGLLDPVVECRFLDEPIVVAGGLGILLQVLASADVPGDSDIARFCALASDRPERCQQYGGRTSSWPSVLPSHRELAAAHLLPHVAGTEDHGWGQGGLVLDLAEADGPAGAATGTLLACALVNRAPQERANAVEAFLAFGGRGQLPAAETGAALGHLTALGRITFSRAVRSLTSAADAGAHADVWATAAAALPHVLPAPGERAAAGVPDLLGLATRVAESTGVRGAIPAVADVAARGGSSRLVKESARLHRTLAT
ncbi:DUF6493 family protein [Actinomadura meridiana]|uniref:DUF6493 family protein n=1 Tax=Actinomadura meridiana TaxID=559626 RepID=A0ABP8CQQ2_9ACTN